MYYTPSGIITPVGGRPLHRLREMHGQQNIKKYVCVCVCVCKHRYINFYDKGGWTLTQEFSDRPITVTALFVAESVSQSVHV